MMHPWQLTTQLIIFQHKKKDIFQGPRTRSNLQNWLKWRHFASAVFFMALVFCLNLSCSLGCWRSEDSPQQAFCHFWGGGVKWPIACVFVTPGFDIWSTWGRELRRNRSKRIPFSSAENFNADENGISPVLPQLFGKRKFWEAALLQSAPREDLWVIPVPFPATGGSSAAPGRPLLLRWHALLCFQGEKPLWCTTGQSHSSFRKVPIPRFGQVFSPSVH